MQTPELSTPPPIIHSRSKLGVGGFFVLAEVGGGLGKRHGTLGFSENPISLPVLPVCMCTWTAQGARAQIPKMLARETCDKLSADKKYNEKTNIQVLFLMCLYYLHTGF